MQAVNTLVFYFLTFTYVYFAMSVQKSISRGLYMPS